jgi:NDP-4-keto-2,6-dideoxyhexose 3-C-methyltransferase
MHAAAPANVTRCRICKNPELIPCFSLGAQYLSSMFPETLDYHDQVPRLPLDLVMCAPGDPARTCGLIQLAHELDLSAMYAAYPYTSATNAAMPKVLRSVADAGRDVQPLRGGDTVLDIGCNDGTLLEFFRDSPVDLVGIDPAKNVAFSLTPDRCAHVRDYFSAGAYRAAAAKPAKLIFSIAMFYHLSDPVAFARDVAECLADDGVWVVQMAYLPSMIATNMYDNIVHEHAGYYGTRHMSFVMDRAGLEVFDVELNDVYGGSFRVFVKKKGNTRLPPTKRLLQNLQSEEDAKIYDVETYRAFAGRIDATRADLRAFVKAARSAGKSIWVYGASTKGNTILQYCGVGKDDVVAAADASPFKLGKYIVGADVPIRDEASMRAARPDYLLALPYSFVDAFVTRESALVSSGTRFVVPLPEVKLVPS